jgi:hypothetical protein
MPNLIAAGDTSTIAQVAGFLTSKGRKFRVRTQAVGGPLDLREGPAVLIGAFDNDQLRYSLVWDTGRGVSRIKDRRNPSQETWETSAHEDYALITRMWDKSTGRAMLVAGGLTMAGTVAAGEFLTDPKSMEDLAAAAPKGWASKNLQVIIATRIPGGPSRLQAIQTW